MKNKRRFMLFFMFLLLPITLNYFSPYIVIDGLINKVISGAFLIWTIMFVTSLFVGRAFCSYICPYGGLQMVMDRAIEKPLKEVKFLRGFKYSLGVIWLCIILFFLMISLGDLKLNPLYLTENIISVDETIKVIGYYVIVVGIGLFPMIFGKRGSCHYICPMSIINIIGTKLSDRLNLPALRLTSNSSKCEGCNKCTRACPMSLKVMDAVKSGNINKTECILCGECTKACRNNAIIRVYGRGNNLCQDKSKHQRNVEKNL